MPTTLQWNTFPFRLLDGGTFSFGFFMNLQNSMGSRHMRFWYSFQCGWDLVSTQRPQLSKESMKGSRRQGPLILSTSLVLKHLKGRSFMRVWWAIWMMMELSRMKTPPIPNSSKESILLHNATIKNASPVPLSGSIWATLHGLFEVFSSTNQGWQSDLGTNYETTRSIL